MTENNEQELLSNDEEATNTDYTEGQGNEGEVVEENQIEKMEQLDGDQLNLSTLEVNKHVEGVVVSLAEKHVEVEVANCASVCIVPISELSNFHVEKVSDVVTVGDTLDLIVIKIDDNKGILSKKRFDAESVWGELEAKFNNGDIITSLVTDVVKGGLVVDIGLRGFVPASMASDSYVEDLSIYMGNELEFKIVEMDRESFRVILSRREVLKYHKEQEESDFIDSMNIGDVIEGKVVRLSNFGAFVSLGKVEGLVHVSEIARHHVLSPEEVLHVDQVVDVKVIKIDKEAKRVGLSIKELLPEPWDVHKDQLFEGNVLKGTVKRFADFGVFVELFPSIEGLLHISEISNNHISNPRDVLREGEVIDVQIIKVNASSRKISLSVKVLKVAEETINEIPDSYKESPSGFSIGEIFAEQLKNINIEEK